MNDLIATLVIKDPKLLLTCNSKPDDLVGREEHTSIAIKDERILGIGSWNDLDSRYDLSRADVIDAHNKIVAPGFVDSHTHVVFGGSRVQEYAAKMTRSPEKLRKMGIPTGINASVMMTRDESFESLVEQSSKRILGMLKAGTTTIESKSGYGLRLDDELKMLYVNQKLQETTPLDLVSTFLGAHAFPPGVDQEDYVEEIIQVMIPAVYEENIAQFCDVYIDKGFFNLSQTRRILETAREYGMNLKIHADQYSALGGSELAAEMGAVSADHLNYTKYETMQKLAKSNVVGVLMPLIDFAVQHPQPFNARAMMNAGMAIALATDFCPGGWTESMQLVLQFACRQHAFSPEEALYAATVGGAKALSLYDRGELAPGKLADIQMWDIPTFEDIIYRLGHNAVEKVIKRGKVVVDQ